MLHNQLVAEQVVNFILDLLNLLRSVQIISYQPNCRVFRSF
jgi:hypothetical protein